MAGSVDPGAPFVILLGSVLLAVTRGAILVYGATSDAAEKLTQIHRGAVVR
jgi:hypothetical protein